MAKKRSGLFLELSEGVLASLGKVTEYKGVPVKDYLELLVVQAVPQITEAAREAQRPGPGRPARPAPPRLPDDIERGAVASGFTGVYKNGKYWDAYWDKGEGSLGLFDTAEDAAIARYWYDKGRTYVGRLALTDPSKLTNNTPPPTTAPEVSFKVGDIVDYDPVIGRPPARRRRKIVEGPLPIEGGTIGWRLDGENTPVHQEDLQHAGG